LRVRNSGKDTSWIQLVQADDLPYLHSLTVGLRRDQAAVTAGLTEDHNSGPVEGHVNRINDQAADVRPGHLRPTPKANPLAA
jgi:transposase